MKTVFRVLAIASIVPVLIAGNFINSNKPAANNTMVAVYQSADVPGPLPTCNPFTQKCPNIRER